MTNCVEGSKRIIKTKNKIYLAKCRCSSCGIIKSRFMKAINVKAKGKGLLLGKNSPFNGIPLLGSIF